MAEQHGYTKINNDILERLAILPFNTTQIKIIIVVCRYTFGFGRNEHGISENFLSKATGISKRHISSELRKLVDSKILNVIRESTSTKPRIIALNKIVNEWMSGSSVPPMKASSTDELQFHSISTVSLRDEKEFHQVMNPSSTQGGSSIPLRDEVQFHQEIYNSKETLKENIKESGEEWSEPFKHFQNDVISSNDSIEPKPINQVPPKMNNMKIVLKAWGERSVSTTSMEGGRTK